MPIHYQWHNPEKTVINLVFDKNWTWDDYIQIQQELFLLIDTVNHTVHYLIDIQKSRSLPLGALNKLPMIFSQTHPRRGKTIILGANPTIHNIWNLLRKIVPQMGDGRYFFVSSMEEAQNLFQSWKNEGQTSLANRNGNEENQV